MACLEVSLWASSFFLHYPCLRYALAELNMLWFAPNEQTSIPKDVVSAPKPAQRLGGSPLLHRGVGSIIFVYERDQTILIPIDMTYNVNKSSSSQALRYILKL